MTNAKTSQNAKTPTFDDFQPSRGILDMDDYARPKTPAAAPYDNRPDFPPAPRLGWLSRIRYDIDNYHLQKGVMESYEKAQKKAFEAATQGTIVAPALDAWGAYDSPGGMQEPTGRTFSTLRAFAERCEPVGAIHNKRIEQVAAFCRPATSRWGRSMTAGYRIRMTSNGSEANKDDIKEMETLTQYFAEAGFCPPPEEERPVGWQPGLEAFVRGLIRDQLTMDWVAVRTWPSASDPKKFPVVAFAAVDAALIRNKRRVVDTFVDGVNVYEKQDNQRTNLTRPGTPVTGSRQKTFITHVKVDSDGGGREVEEYTDEELFCAYMRPRTDVSANGYGYSVMEQAMNAITIWCAARDLNALRFDRDAAPRGILTVLGQMNPQQFNKFVQDWKSMMLGVRNRHTMPILQGSPIAGSSVQYTPIDPNPRDMEYSQFTFAVGLWMHCLYGIHPDETGFSASSPFRPPLSEASPESNLKYSQDTGLSPMLRWLENLLNRHILWRIRPDRRYTFEFVGTGDFNLMDDINERTASMNAGLTTPMMNWNELDITAEIDPQWLNHPAAKMPGSFAANLQLLMSMKQAKDAEDQQQQASEQQEAQGQQDQDQQGKNDDAATQQQQMDAEQQEHGQNMDKFHAALEQRKVLARAAAQQGQGQDPQGVEDDDGGDDESDAGDAENSSQNSDSDAKKTGNNTAGHGTIKAGSDAEGDGPETAPGFLARPDAGKRYGGGASSRPMAKRAMRKGVSERQGVDYAQVAGEMQKAIDGQAAVAASIGQMARGRRSKRLGPVIVRR